MKRKYFSCIVVLAVLSATSAWSQALDLSAIAEAALTNDPERLIAIAQLRAAEADAAATKTKRLIDGSASAQVSRSDPGDSSPVGPTDTVSGDLSATSSLPLGSTLSLGGSYGYSTNDKADSDTATVTAGISVPVFVNGKFVDPGIGGAAKTSGIDLPVEAARDVSDLRARATVDAAFRLALDAASAARSVSLAERRSAIADRDLAIAEVKRDQGTIGYSDLAEKQRAADEARLSALEARLSRDAKIRALCAATGMDFGRIDPAALESLAAPASPSADALLSNAPESAEARKAERDRRSAESSRILAGAEIAPTFGLQSSVTVPGPASRSEAKDAGLGEPDTSWSASASVSIPLPTGYGGNRLRAADARVSAARIAEANVAQSSANRVTELRDAWTACDAKVTLRAQLLAQATSRLELVRASLDRQTATALDADRAELAVAEARSALEDSKSDLFKAALDMATRSGIDPRTIVKETQK
jgi:outer membrane protein TolC